MILKKSYKKKRRNKKSKNIKHLVGGNNEKLKNEIRKLLNKYYPEKTFQLGKGNNEESNKDNSILGKFQSVVLTTKDKALKLKNQAASQAASLKNKATSHVTNLTKRVTSQAVSLRNQATNHATNLTKRATSFGSRISPFKKNELPNSQESSNSEKSNNETKPNNNEVKPNNNDVKPNNNDVKPNNPPNPHINVKSFKQSEIESN